MQTLLYIIIASLITSLGSLLGILFISVKKERLQKMLLGLVALAAGTMLGGAFLHLLPEAVEEFNAHFVFSVTLASFLIFFIIEKVLHWHHCHKDDCEEYHTFGYMTLIGDSLHNFLDGLLIAGSFVVDIHLGIVTTIAITLHEIPQEIADFGVLIHSGFKKNKALLLNFLIALMALVGALFGYFATEATETIEQYILPAAAGGFLYISMADLIPQLKKEDNSLKSIVSALIVVFGILIMYFLTFLEAGH